MRVSIELKGRDVTRLGPLALSRLGVGRTFRRLQVFGKMTVRDNLIVAAQEHNGSLFSRMFAPERLELWCAKPTRLIDQFRIAPRGRTRRQVNCPTASKSWSTSPWPS
jgi:branched-chain amino acid transport system ATP-binding protein